MRYATHADFEVLYDAAYALIGKSKALHMKLVDPDVARLSIANAIAWQRIIIEGDYAAMFDIGSDWYSSTPILIEQFVWRFKRTSLNRVEDIVGALEEEAANKGCAAIVCGDTQGLGIMAKHYTAAGFTCLGTQHMKELYGICT